MASAVPHRVCAHSGGQRLSAVRVAAAMLVPVSAVRIVTVESDEVSPQVWDHLVTLERADGASHEVSGAFADTTIADICRAFGFHHYNAETGTFVVCAVSGS